MDTFFLTGDQAWLIAHVKRLSYICFKVAVVEDFREINRSTSVEILFAVPLAKEPEYSRLESWAAAQRRRAGVTLWAALSAADLFISYFRRTLATYWSTVNMRLLRTAILSQNILDFRQSPLTNTGLIRQEYWHPKVIH